MGHYTDDVTGGYWSYAVRTTYEIKDMVGDMEEEATAKDWGELLEKIRREYTCSVRFFLMRYLFEEDGCMAGRVVREGEGYRIAYGGRTYHFHKVTPEHAFALPDEERDQYVELLTRIAADRHDDPPRVWRPLMRKAMLRNKEVRLLTRQEGFQLAHGLGFGLDRTEAFLLRALENDGFCYTRSEDLIEAFCFLYGPADDRYTAQQLKARYHEQTDHLPKHAVALKPDAFTQKIAQSLPAWIRGWCAGGGEEMARGTGREAEAVRGTERETGAVWGTGKETEMVRGTERETATVRDTERETETVRATERGTGQSRDPGASEQDGMETAVTDAFMTWLIVQAPFLDIPSRSAWQIYRRAAAFAHTVTRALTSGSADEQEAILEPLFAPYMEGEGTYLTDMIMAYCLGDEKDQERGQEEDQERGREEGQEGGQEKGETGTDGVAGRGFVDGEDPYRTASDLLWMAYEGAGDSAAKEAGKGKGPAGLWRYLTADQKGRLTVKAIGSRIPLLLSGEEAVTKADLLFLLWSICDLSWMAWGQDTEDFLYERLAGFWSLAEELLDKAMLPPLYAPHLLERGFLYAICAEDPGGGSPFELYEELCAYALPARWSRRRVKKVDPAEGRRYRRLLKKKARELYRTGQIDLEGLGEALSAHFGEHGKEGGIYRFTPEGICYQEKKLAVPDPEEPVAIPYPRAGTGRRFDRSRGDYKTPRVQEERFLFLYGLVLDLAGRWEGIRRRDFRINYLDHASVTILHSGPG
ncbi:MAG: hypothetical protein HFG22_17240 [Lachnospiraceae bacterium]|nr:hypothetical protein [Lachnospiraceae bacterium]